VAAYSLHAPHRTLLGVFFGACVVVLWLDWCFAIVTTVVLHLHVLCPWSAGCASVGFVQLHALLACVLGMSALACYYASGQCLQMPVFARASVFLREGGKSQATHSAGT
jgi:hypothetical protein